MENVELGKFCCGKNADTAGSFEPSTHGISENILTRFYPDNIARVKYCTIQVWPLLTS